MKTTSTTRKLTRFQYAATLLGGLAIAILAPATAHANNNDDDPAGPGGCHYTDSAGYDIPIHNGYDVVVDGKIVACKDGKTTVTPVPKRGVDGVRPVLVDPDLAPVTDAPQQPSVIRNVPVSKAP